MSDSTKSPRARKPDRPVKPYPDFPLTPHASGAWQKKIRGKIHYFGKWGRRVNGKLERIAGDGWESALKAYREVADDLHAGRTPRVASDGLTVADLCNRFLTAKLRKKEAGELGQQTYADYKIITDILVATFGARRLVQDLAADDFAMLRDRMSKQWGPMRLGYSVVRVRSVFKFGVDNGFIEKTVRYGSEFKKPDQAVIRQHKAKNGERMLEPEQLHTLLDAASVPLKAMALLGLNCGFGNTDVASLPIQAVNMGSGWVNFPRPKNGIARRCPLWPETIEAIKIALDERPKPADFESCGLVFLTSTGTPMIRPAATYRSDRVAERFGDLLKATGLHRRGLGFYTLRHIFRTIADAARDTPAADLIMGHTDPSMAGHYREPIDDARLKAVTDYVHAWLWPTEKSEGGASHA